MVAAEAEGKWQGNKGRLFSILEETRKEFRKVLPPELSNRDIILVALGARLAQIHNLSNEGKGVGHFVHFTQIRQDLADLQVLLSRLDKQHDR